MTSHGYDNLWTVTAPPAPLLRSLTGDRQVSVCVVGGGLTGLSAALHLAEAGRSVLVLEAKRLGHGASGRNAAGYAPVHADRTPAEVEAMLGQAAGARLNALVAGSGRLLADLADRCGPITGRRASSVLMTASKPAKMARLRAMADQWCARGGAVELLEGAALARATGREGFGLGLRMVDGGTLHPLGLVHGLASLALTAGAAIAIDSPATGIKADNGGWRVITPMGVVRADRVLIATDAYEASKTLWPGLERAHYAVPLAMAATTPWPENVPGLPPDGQPIADIDEPSPFWLMRDQGGRLVSTLLPPSGESVDVTTLAAPFSRRLARLYPGLPVPEWQYLWLGTVAMTPNRLPRLIHLAAGVHALGGYSGQGLTTALAAGRDYAITVDVGRPEACSLPIVPLRPVPLSRTLPLVLQKLAFPLVRALAK